MAGKSGPIERALDAASPAIRCYLLYGPDDSGSRALAARLAKAMGDGAERIDLSPAQLKSDPALLSDEAASVSLFGGARHILVDGAGDDCLAAVDALLQAPAAGNPVVLIGGALRKDAKLVKRIEGDPAGMAFQSYPPSDAEADQIAVALGHDHGLRIGRDVARRLADSAGADRALLTQEIVKLALYADATPETPRELTQAMIDAVGAESGDADLSNMVDAVLGGDELLLDRELVRLASEGQQAIPLAGAVRRRLLVMAGARAEMDRGSPPKMAVEKSAKYLFWKDKDAIARDLPKWSPARIALAVDRLGHLERQLKSSAGPGSIAADALFFAIAQAARRRR